MKRLATGVLLLIALGGSVILLAGGERFTLAVPGTIERVSVNGAGGVGDISHILQDKPAEETLAELHAVTEDGNAYTTPLFLNPNAAADYPDASGILTYHKVCNAFRGHIDATGLLPGFPYQLKVIGKPSCANAWGQPDDWGNEQLGPEGFWWHYSDGVQTNPSRKVYNDYEEWDDHNHGSDPLPDPDAGYRRPEVPHDFVPAQTEDWCYEGVLVFEGSFSDANGNISWEFVADWSYPHAPPEDNSDDHPFVLPNGPYEVRFVLNESAHNPVGYGGPPTAVWRGVLLDENNAFELSDLDSDGDGFGDGCDSDDDNDTVPDGDDTDPLDPYVCQDMDTDTCDDCSVFGQPDPSNDGTDADFDGLCNASDVCTSDPNNDGDNDGICVGSGYLPPKTGGNDNCPTIPNEDQFNSDTDSHGDSCDNCPLVNNEDQTNTDVDLESGGASVVGDSLGDECDVDDDNDGFNDDVETCLGTIALDNCPGSLPGPGGDAWPLDINMDGELSLTSDVYNYVGRIGATPVDPEWWQRLDLDASGDISVTGDAYMYVGRIGERCT